MSDADRKRLVAILGMLGSASAGERDNAARLAEQFRRQHGLTWAQLFEPQTVYLGREVFPDRPPPEPPPAPPARARWASTTYGSFAVGRGGICDGIA